MRACATDVEAQAGDYERAKRATKQNSPAPVPVLAGAAPASAELPPPRKKTPSNTPF